MRDAKEDARLLYEGLYNAESDSFDPLVLGIAEKISKCCVGETPADVLRAMCTIFVSVVHTHYDVPSAHKIIRLCMNIILSIHQDQLAIIHKRNEAEKASKKKPSKKKSDP